jgi:outer membrane protein TolC
MANYAAAVAEFRQSPLTAFRQVEDRLAALRVLEQETRQQDEATASARESLRVFTERYMGRLDPAYKS